MLWMRSTLSLLEQECGKHRILRCPSISTESLIALAVEGPHESRWKDGLDSLNNSPNRLNTFRQLQEDVSVRIVACWGP